MSYWIKIRERKDMGHPHTKSKTSIGGQDRDIIISRWKKVKRFVRTVTESENSKFVNACNSKNVEPTRRQYSKWLRGFGVVKGKTKNGNRLK